MAGCFGNHPVDRYLESQLNNYLNEDILYCYVCNEQTDFFCEKCEKPICEKHQAEYNQFSQIDFNCCEECASNR